MTILRSQLARITERADSESLSVLRVSRDSQTVDTDELRAFAASVCHPHDVQFECPDNKSFLLLGETIEPDCWIERLRKWDVEYRDLHKQLSIAPLQIEHVEQWPIRDCENRLLQMMTPQPILSKCA